jgi:hypothetical protein
MCWELSSRLNYKMELASFVTISTERIGLGRLPLRGEADIRNTLNQPPTDVGYVLL